MNQCESCGMPLSEDTTSKLDSCYCVYCQNQETGELGSKEQVREGSIGYWVNQEGKTREEAEKLVDETLANLPRWQEEA